MTLQYIIKYTSKSESRSAAFLEIFNQILNNSNPNNPLLTLIQKLLFNSILKQDILAQKISYLIQSLLLYYSSQTFVSLNINKKGLR